MGCGASQSAQVVHMSRPLTGVDRTQPWRGLSYETKSSQTEPLLQAMEATHISNTGGILNEQINCVNVNMYSASD